MKSPKYLKFAYHAPKVVATSCKRTALRNLYVSLV